MKIPYLDLKKQYRLIKKEINSSIQNVLSSQMFILGEQGRSFEKEFANYLGVRYAVGVNSGTDALIISLLALGIGPGDEVITTANSFIATASSITEVGAKPVFVDIDRNTYQIDEDKISKSITKKTRAIIPVHIYGAPCEIDRIMKIAKTNNLLVIEDAAQSHGAMLSGKKTGTFGDLSIFSFYPGKNLGAYGDAGSVCTNSRKLYEKLILLRNYGQKKKYFHSVMGKNSRLDEIQAAVLRVKLKYLNGWNRKRNQIAHLYRNKLKGIACQKIIDQGFSNYHLFVIESPKRARLREFLYKNGVSTLIHYPIPIHLQKCYRNLGFKLGSLPFTERLGKRILSLPIYPELKESEVNYIAKLINEFHT